MAISTTLQWHRTERSAHVVSPVGELNAPNFDALVASFVPGHERRDCIRYAGTVVRASLAPESFFPELFNCMPPRALRVALYHLDEHRKILRPVGGDGRVVALRYVEVAVLLSGGLHLLHLQALHRRDL